MIKKGFTLIEILVVIAVLVVLAAIVMLILNPAEYLRRARDAQRLSDATHINLAMALFNYGASSNSVTEDGDGPRFPNVGSPVGEHDSCVGDPPPPGGVDPRIFVSVPNDITPPAAPPGWQYAQVSSDKLRAVNGDGWLPIDFTQLAGSQPPLAVLPVDPVNTFASGYYYSYGCGSWDLNMRFESAKYQDLTTTDGGSFSNVYEIGNDLTLLPVQPAYAIGNTTSGTFTLQPITSTVGILTGTWTKNNCTDFDNYLCVLNENSSTKYIYSAALNSSALFGVHTTNSQGIPSTTFNLIVWAARSSNGSTLKITPRIDLGGTIYDGIPYLPDYTGTDQTIFTSKTTTITIPGILNWSDINNMKIGVIT
ncbi:MAG: prepilin-type N-terminal cleavage/methylation domain-containing protein, partial [bacterium]|nr:prepilin-type N-terminal cleavage/methylation domain-containing protein [bacterium]